MDGVLAVLACLLVLVLLDLLVDWLFVMDRPQRIVMLALSLCLLTLVAARRLVIPLANMPTDDALCLQLEQGNRHLGEALICSLQFARAEHQAGVSPSMVQAAIEQGVKSAGPLEVDSVLDLGRYRKNWVGLMLVGLLSACAIFVVVGTQFGSIWFHRNVLLQDRDWPQDVYLEFVDMDQNGLRVPRGTNWPLTVVVTEQSRRQPEEVVLEVKQSTMTRSEPMQAADKNRFTASLQNINESIQVRAVADRASTSWISVEPVSYPVVSEMQIETVLPGYAGSERHLLAAGETLGAILEGSQIFVRGKASKPLSLAQLIPRNNRVSQRKTIPVTLSGDQQFDVSMQVMMADSGKYVLEIVDQDRVMQPVDGDLGPLKNSDAARFHVRVRPDRAPLVRLARGDIGLMVVPGARIPFSVDFEEEFGLTQVRLVKQWRTRGPGQDPKRQKSIILLDDIPEQFSTDNRSFDQQLDLREHEIMPVGAELALHIEATDNNDLTGPGVGKSTALRFRVVSTEQLRKYLLQQESRLRKSLGQLQKKQIGTLADSRVLLTSVSQGHKPSRAEIASLAQLQKQQKQLGANLSSINKKIQSIRSELIFNRLDSEANGHHQRLTSQVIEPLEVLTSTEVPEAVLHLDRARRTIGDAGKYQAALQDASEKQAEIDQRIKTIRASMIDDVQFQLVLDLFRETHNNQQDILKRSEEERRRLIQKYLEENSQNGNPGKSKSD